MLLHSLDKKLLFHLKKTSIKDFYGGGKCFKTFYKIFTAIKTLVENDLEVRNKLFGNLQTREPSP